MIYKFIIYLELPLLPLTGINGGGYLLRDVLCTGVCLCCWCNKFDADVGTGIKAWTCSLKPSICGYVLAVTALGTPNVGVVLYVVVTLKFIKIVVILSTSRRIINNNFLISLAYIMSVNILNFSNNRYKYVTCITYYLLKLMDYSHNTLQHQKQYTIYTKT